MVQLIGFAGLLAFVVVPLVLALGATLYDYVVAPARVGRAEIDRLAFATLAAPRPTRALIALRLEEAANRSDGAELGRWRRVARTLGRLVD
jgi:hypothetical protein